MILQNMVMRMVLKKLTESEKRDVVSKRKAMPTVTIAELEITGEDRGRAPWTSAANSNPG